MAKVSKSSSRYRVLPFLAILAINLALCALSAGNLLVIQRAVEVQTNRSSEAFLALKIRNYVEILHGDQVELAGSTYPEDSEYRAYQEQLGNALDRLSALSKGERKREEVNQLELLSGRYFSAFEPVLSASADPRASQLAYERVREDLTEIRSSLISTSNRLTMSAEKGYRNSTEALFSRLKGVFVLLGISAGLAVVFTAIVAVVLAAQNRRYLAEVVKKTLLEAESKRIKFLFSRYVSENVAERLLEEQGDLLSGQRRRVTIMFTDIRGFTQMSESLPPEEVVKVLNAYFSRMVKVALDHGGMIDKFIGDGMMIVFGAPVVFADHAWRAVQAAVGMRNALGDLNLIREEMGQLPLAIGVGLHTGDCVIGSIGSEQRLDYTAIGDTVNTASRLESLTKELKTDIVMSSETYLEVHARVKIRPVSNVGIRGKSTRLDVFILEDLLPEAVTQESTTRTTVGG